MGSPSPLDTPTAVALLRGYGLVPAEAEIRVTTLSGGVSSTVLLAEAPHRRFVLKQPRERFAVRDEWVVDIRRCFVEHAFVQALRPLLPREAIPPVVAFAPQWYTLVFEALPPQWGSWKARLLSDRFDAGLADASARLLAAIHDAGSRAELAGRFQNHPLFVQQREDPYFVTTAQRLPVVAPYLSRLQRLFRQRQDLVHGDFSPKNLMTNGTELRLIDHEVATRGDAAFDVGFLLTHLTLKSFHLPDKRRELLALATRFLRTYVQERDSLDPDVEPRALQFMGGLLLARVIGKSPVEYLSDANRCQVRTLARDWLEHSPSSWAKAQERLLPRDPDDAKRVEAA